MLPSVRRTARFAGLLVLAVLTCDCDIDLFGLDERPVAGAYRLHVWEGGRYTLETPGPRDGCGVLGGWVRRIGWSDQLILAEQETCGGKGARSGWVVVNVKAKSIDPIEEPAIAGRPELARIKVFDAETAFKQLK
jgi:hypothetical protein